MKKEEYLSKIRELDGLKNAVLSHITVDKKNSVIEFFLVTDRAYTAQEADEAALIGGRYVPTGFDARAKIAKRTPDAEMIRQKIYQFVKESFPAAAAFLSQEDIGVEMLPSGAQFSFAVASGEQSLFTADNILDAVSGHLRTMFCGAFLGSVRIVDKEYDDALLHERPVVEDEPLTTEIRFFDVCRFQRIDGATPVPKSAVYAADLSATQGEVSVCGKIAFIEEKQYVKVNEKTGEEVQKSRFSISVNDSTGFVRTTYFPKKATVDKIRALQAGDSIVITGENEEYRGNISFKASKIDLGEQPEGFVPVEKKSKPVPRAYRVVNPTPYVDYTQADFFTQKVKPDDLLSQEFVVFDLETTGLVRQPSMGKMDRIIEVGAVKIKGGEIVEKFSSFVACPEKLPADIVNLTGIHDEDLVGAPEIAPVMADFFKFCDGCSLVGHNVNFDYDFVSYYAGVEGFFFSQKKYDTLTLAQEVLRGEGLSNFKLNTVADYFSFTFQHHRAFDDALVTAKVFIELLIKRGGLPY